MCDEPVQVRLFRLDRAQMGVPELRTRTRQMAERAVGRLRSLKQEEFVGELLGLEWKDIDFRKHTIHVNRT